MNPHAVVTLAPPQANEPDHIHVFLCDCTVEMRVGFHPSERTGPQPVVVAIEAEAALPHRYQDVTENSLDRVIDYEVFYRFIREELPKLGHVPLLETVAEQIADFCFRDLRIQKVRVRLEKPRIYAGTARAGIEICRSRPGAAP
ncbi:MAG TPA: dihydroneopterin aldolase [Alphaproteobacteria bacterium]|nr:dihydroneopterin aldolase [Alphaproteobacteria bacterium]